MSPKHSPYWKDSGAPDREMIQVAPIESSAGIAAALRRAFQAAAAEPSDHDFAALIARLN